MDVLIVVEVNFFFLQVSFFDIQCQLQPPDKLLKVGNPLRCLTGLFTPRGNPHKCSIFNQLVLPLRSLVFAEVVVLTQFCLGTFTAEGLKNNRRFKLGRKSSSFSFRHRRFLSMRLLLWHNLGYESGPNFREQYKLS